MSALVGALLGAGVFLVWWSCWTRPTGTRTRHAGAGTFRTLLLQAGLPGVAPATFVALSLALAAVAGLLTFAVTSAVVFGLCVFVVALGVPLWLVRRRARRRTAVLREVWPDVVDHLRSAIRAGMGLPEALMQLQYRGPEPLRPSFTQFAADYRASGQLHGSLTLLKQRLADPVADNIVEALRVTREVGGTDLGKLLGTLSEFLRENERTRSELEARQSWTVNAARLSVAAPWLILALMATQPAAVQAYNTAAGAVVLLGGLVVSVVAYQLMLRLGALPEEQRVLR
ncbi:type II secretion system F family protein [Kocuria rhizophila]|uniref:Type II secretion system protein F n=1 Tax=Kocuria rhizophila TaxID=72000 RepID=A0AAX2SGS6_KOCRH|nr:type II secretion system F family protein [Kocuria rhizophila]MCR4526697.1 type II secretion system F family protein [Kocuria rhizophila]TFI03246.1 type II secretion system protein F [Kocuria rhizophila]TFI09184.1 type II secretion system protein F [Kocuria rhizophila]